VEAESSLDDEPRNCAATMARTAMMTKRIPARKMGLIVILWAHSIR